MLENLIHSDIYLTTFWYTAIPVSLIFIVQMILAISGLNVDTDIDSGQDASIDGVGIAEVFTLRNLINFLLGFSWGGICFYSSIESKFFLVTAAVVTGVVFVALFFYVIQQIKKLEENNTFDIYEIIGKEGDVYLRIPGYVSGKGKVQISHRGTLHELDAVTEDDIITTGSKVRILDIQDKNTLVVTKL